MKRSRLAIAGFAMLITVALASFLGWNTNAFAAAPDAATKVVQAPAPVSADMLAAIKGHPHIPDKIKAGASRLARKTVALRAPTVSVNTTLSANKTYNDTVTVGSKATLNLNHKTMVVNGDMLIRGCVDVKGGILKVYGDLTVIGQLKVDGGSVIVYKTPGEPATGNLVINGTLYMNSSVDKVTVTSGQFIAGGYNSQYSLNAGTIDVNGNFIQLGTASGASFAPKPALKVVIRGSSSQPRMILFETPEQSYFTNLSFPAGTVVSPLSVISLRVNLTSDYLVSIPKTVVYFSGNLNGHTLRATCMMFITTPDGYLNFSGGKVYVTGSAGFGEYSNVSMTNQNDYFYVKNDFFAASTWANLSAGMLEIGGGFRQLGRNNGMEPDTFTPKPGFTVKFDGYYAQTIFDDPDSSYYSNVILGPSACFSANTYESVPIHLDLQKDTELNFPNLHYSGNLNGKNLTIDSDFTIGYPGIWVNGGSLHAKRSVHADGPLTMKNSLDSVVVDGTYFMDHKVYNPGAPSLLAGTIRFNGNFTIALPGNDSSGYSAFLAAGTLKTILSGANKKVIFTSPQNNYFADLEIALGTTFTSDSVLSVNLFMGKDYTFNVPSLYFSGGLHGHTLTVSGNLSLGTVFFDKGRINAGRDLTALSSLYMRDAEDLLDVHGDFTSLGNGISLQKGRIDIEGDFTRAAGSYVAGPEHTTVFCGTGQQTIALDSASASANKFGTLYIANPQAEFDPGTTFYDSIVQTGTDLSSITVDNGALTPVFMPFRRQYIAVLPKDTDATTVHGTRLYDNATLAIDDDSTDSKAYEGIPYDSSTDVRMEVSTPGGLTSKTYTVKLERLNTDLSSIALSTGELSPAFAPDTLAYTVELPAGTDSIDIKPTVMHPDSSYTIDGGAVSHETVGFIPGETKTITIRVIGQDGKSTKEYTVTVHRAPLLDNISASGGTLSPSFGFTTDEYTVEIPVTDTTATVTPVPSAGCASITINGVQQSSVDVTIDEPGGRSVVTIVAEAADGGAAHTYRVTVRRGAALSGFGDTSGATLAPAYDPIVHAYTLTLPAPMDTVHIAPARNAGCTEMDIKVGDGEYQTVDFVDISPEVGQSIPVCVQAKAGDTIVQTYTINVVRKAIVSGIKLTDNNNAAIAVDAAFSPTAHAYRATMEATAGYYYLNVIKLSGAVTINGKSTIFDGYQLAPGESRTLTIVATDGAASVTYSIEIRKAKPLDSLSVSPLTFENNAAFQPGAKNQFVRMLPTATELHISVAKNESCSAVKINGVECAEATLQPAYGMTVYSIEATDRESGVVSHYQLVVNRDILVTNLLTSGGNFSQNFTPAVDHYTLILPKDTATVVISAVTTNMCYHVQELLLNVPLGGSATGTLTARSTAGLSYPITVTAYRIAPITGIKVMGGALSTAFSITNYNYTVSVPATTSAVTLTPTTASSCSDMTINNQAVTSVTLRPAAGGSAAAVIRAKAVNGQVFTYTVTVKRAALVTGISTSAGKLSPAFNPATAAYTVTVPYTTARVTVTAKKAATGIKSFLINGGAATSVTLAPAIGGSARTTIVALAADGKTKFTYTVVVIRQPAPKP